MSDFIPDGWVRLVRAEEVPPGRARFLTAGDRDLSVFHAAEPDRYFVTTNSCPHAGGNLSAGELRGREVTCPWHHWTFDLESGECTLAPNVKLRRFPCKVEEGWVWAKLA